MNCATLLLPGMVILLLAQPRTGREAADPGPKLTFAQDGKDLVVSTTIEITDAPCVLWAHAELVMDHDLHLLGPRRPPQLAWVELSYHVIQSRDDPNLLHRRHQTKKVEITWRLAGHQKADVRYRVVGQFNPSAVDLKELAPKLLKLAEETERRQRSPLATP